MPDIDSDVISSQLSIQQRQMMHELLEVTVAHNQTVVKQSVEEFERLRE